MFKNNKNQKKFLNVLILCTLIFTLALQINPVYIRKDISNNLRSSAEYDPAGLIAMWSGPLNTIPAGWKLMDGTGGTINTTNRFVYSTDSMEAPGATGGNASHNHTYATVPSHDHGVTSTTATPHSHDYARPTSARAVGWNFVFIPWYSSLTTAYTSTGANSALHSHGVQPTGGTGLYMSEEENFIPPYYEMAFIQKETNDAIIPTGLIVMWAGNIDSIPADWELCNGSNGTPDLRDKFIRGALQGEDPGTSGGNLTHNHTYTDIPTHSHSIATGGDSHIHDNARGTNTDISYLILAPTAYSSTSGNTNYASVPHTHDISDVGVENSTTQDTDNLPPYFKVAFIMNTVVSNALPLGVISMWGDSIENIPLGWNQCNGTTNTPDLLNKFPRGVGTGEEPGIVGGSDTHRHIYTDVPNHTHTVLSDSMSHRHSIRTNAGSFNALGGGTSIFCSVSIVDTTTISSPAHNHDVLPTGASTPYTAYATSLPPYVKVIYIQKGLSISNPSPEDGATDISYNPILSVDINTLAGYDLNVSFYNASDNSIIDSDIILGGTGSASVTWSGLSSGTIHSWYIKANDSSIRDPSDTWSFTTNVAPNVPTNPTPNDEATSISYSPTLSVDVFDDDGDDLTVRFYDASDDSIIDADIVVGGSGTASGIWSGLSIGTSYSWYVKSDDGLSVNQSPTWLFTTNNVPSVPTNPTPNDGATCCSYSPTLSVDVFDEDGDDLNVSFYDASDDSIIDSDIVLGGSATASITWSELSSATSYSWYAISDDGINVNQSITWSFTTNNVPNDPTNPIPNDGATCISYSPTLSVDVFDEDGDDLNVSFYDASDDSIIDSDIVVGGSGTASITWSGLSSDTSYSWYAISDDGISVNQSATWSFTTNHAPDEPENPAPSDGAVNVEDNPTLSVDVFDEDGDDLTVTFYNASDDSIIDTVIISGGSGTASVNWSGVSSNMICAWYVIADDGMSTTKSSTCTFTTIDDKGTSPPNILLPVLITAGSIGIGTIGTVSAIVYLRRRKRLE